MRGLGQWSERYVVVDGHDLLLTTTQLVPQATREQERTKLLKKICDDFKNVCNSMDNVHKDMSQHVEDICRMKLEVSQMCVRTRSDTIPINPDPEPYRLISPPHLDLAMPFPVSPVQIRSSRLVSL